MGLEAKIISVEIKQENGINKIILTCEARFGHNIQALLYNPAGDFSIPLPNDFVTLISITGSGNYIAIGNLNNETDVSEGEKKLYSRDSNGNTKSSIYLNNTGKLIIDTDGEIDINGGGAIKIDGTTDIELNGNTKKFVTYTELNNAITGFLIALNAEFAKKKDEAGGAGAITFDISAAETTTIKTGG